jgi:hypothetical protein
LQLLFGTGVHTHLHSIHSTIIFVAASESPTAVARTTRHHSMTA